MRYFATKSIQNINKGKIMGFFSFLTTSEKAVNTAADLAKDAAKGIDALFFTAEEKSAASIQAIELWVETQKIIRDEGSIRSVTRRILAIMILGTFLAEGITSIVLFKFDPLWSAQVLAIMKSQGMMVGAVTVFYFGYYGWKQITGQK